MLSGFGFGGRMEDEREGQKDQEAVGNLQDRQIKAGRTPATGMKTEDSFKKYFEFRTDRM